MLSGIFFVQFQLQFLIKVPYYFFQLKISNYLCCLVTFSISKFFIKEIGSTGSTSLSRLLSIAPQSLKVEFWMIGVDEKGENYQLSIFKKKNRGLCSRVLYANS